ncbi:P-loop NTPase fold protein [Paenibacillus illinoisensis]|uniref:P-loop NTPase fold protein n=1 Tax=Paenibacillus illinoisensis TaxID=59845 RepID=UPI003D27BFDD
MFPTRRRELERIKGYMTSQQYQEPFALAINAPFGEGKSSLVQVLTTQLKTDKNKVLFLKPTITDNKDKLITYFFGQLEILLKESGIYTGHGSALRKYVEQFGKLIDNNKFDAFLDLLGFFEKEKKEEYRETKRRLEEDIKQMLSSSTKENIKRLYIVVDDFDRAQENTMLETLIFIKELVDFKYCGVLFLMNYDLVVTGEKISRDYLDKFIGKRFDLEKISYSQIFNYYIVQSQLMSLEDDEYIDFINDEMNLLQIHAMSYLDEAEESLSSNLESLRNLHQLNSQNKNKENTDLLKLSKLNLETAEKDLQQFKDKLNNPRRLKRIL